MNGARGEVLVPLGGQTRKLCLTLGALAEIEAALSLSGLEELAARMRSLSAQDLLAVLRALLRGAGEAAFADALASSSVEPREAGEALAQAFRAAAG